MYLRFTNVYRSPRSVFFICCHFNIYYNFNSDLDLCLTLVSEDLNRSQHPVACVTNMKLTVVFEKQEANTFY